MSFKETLEAFKTESVELQKRQAQLELPGVKSSDPPGFSDQSQCKYYATPVLADAHCYARFVWLNCARNAEVSYLTNL